MRNLLDFFDAENRRDWKAYEKFLAPDVEWVAYGPPGRTVVRGRERYMRAMKKAYRNVESRFHIVNIALNPEKDLVMAELELDSRRSVDIFEFKRGLIWREREYYDDNVWIAEMANSGK